MQDNDEKTDEEQEKRLASTKQETKPILSRREIRGIVRDFIVAWLSGQIKLDFPTAKEAIDVAKVAGRTIDFDQARKQEVNGKTTFRRCVNICVGAVEATPEEQQKALSEMFDTIVRFRNGDRIIGNFMNYELEERISHLEEGLNVTNNLVEEIVEWIYRGRVDSD
jgi:hypothetical protein